MRFLRNWLRVDRPPGVAPSAAQTIELQQPYAQAFEGCVRGVEDVLGGSVRESDTQSGRIEATFGLIDSERLSCTLLALDPNRTRISIESRRGASAEPAKPSQYVRALAEFLQTGARNG